MHKNSGLDAQHPHMNTLQYPLNLVGWQGSQVTEHAQALAGTVNTASLNSTEDHIEVKMFTFVYLMILIISYLHEPCAYIKVRIHIYLLCRSTSAGFRPF